MVTLSLSLQGYLKRYHPILLKAFLREAMEPKRENHRKGSPNKPSAEKVKVDSLEHTIVGIPLS